MRGGQVLPVLDGLDELPALAQAAVITALNRSLGADDQVVLTSRTTEYFQAVDAAAHVVTSAAVIEPDPVTPADAADYLERCLHRTSPAWRQFLAGLRAGPVPPESLTAVAEVAATPLGLWLLRTVYIGAGADPAPLLDQARFPSGSALHADLLDQVIPALIAIRIPSDDRADPFRPRHHHDPVQVRRWLGYLATQMTMSASSGGAPQATRDFQWWQLAASTRAITRPVRYLLGLGLGLGFGLTVYAAFQYKGSLLAGTLMLLLATGARAQRSRRLGRLRVLPQTGALARRAAVGLTLGYAGGALSHFALTCASDFSTCVSTVPAWLTLAVYALIVSAFAVEVALASRKWDMQSPGFADIHTAGRIGSLARSLAAGLASGAGIGLAFALLFTYLYTAGDFMVFGGYGIEPFPTGSVVLAIMSLGLAGGLLSGFTTWVEVPPDEPGDHAVRQLAGRSDPESLARRLGSRAIRRGRLAVHNRY